MNKIIATDDKLDLDWIDNMGTYNTLPSPAQETTFEEFLSKMNHRHAKYTEHRQVYPQQLDLDGPMRSVIIFWFDLQGFALVSHYNNKQTVLEKVYKLGCNHKFKELSSRECAERGKTHWGYQWHAFECEKCGSFTAYDSSG